MLFFLLALGLLDGGGGTVYPPLDPLDSDAVVDILRVKRHRDAGKGGR